MSAIDVIRAKHAAALSGELKHVYSEYFDDEENHCDGKIYYRPMSVRQEGRILSKKEGANDVPAYVEALLCRALNSEGNARMFPDAARNVLFDQLPPAELYRIVDGMTEDGDFSRSGESDQEKKS